MARKIWFIIHSGKNTLLGRLWEGDIPLYTLSPKLYSVSTIKKA